MPDHEPLPIYSTRESDPSYARRIERFVVDLAEQVDGLQDAEVEGDLEILGDLATGLARRADDAGYPEFVDIARILVRACDEEKTNDAQAALVRLTELGKRIRMGHRGAA